MKQCASFIFMFFATMSLFSQSNIFVLVDVSRSISQTDMNDAKQALSEVLTGSAFSKAFISQGSMHDLANFKLNQGDKLAIAKFGSLATTLQISLSPKQINRNSMDLSQILNSFTWTPTDGQTYITLAKAKIAEYAKNHNIIRYKLYIISDNVQDDYGSGGSPSYPDDYTRNLAEGYNTSTNQVNEAGYTKIKFGASSLFTLSFSPSVDITNYNVPGNSSTTTSPLDLSVEPSITLTSYGGGKKDNPKLISSNSFTISWTSNCPSGTKYSVSLSELDGGKFKDKKSNVTTNMVKFSDVPSGKFKISVSASSGGNAITYISIPTSKDNLVIFLVLLILSSGIGYYFWNKKRQEKIDENATNKTDDIFSNSNNKGSSSNTTSNSDYF